MAFKWDWKKYWVALYAVGLVLFPPIYYHDKIYFAAEWLLIPLFLNIAVLAWRGDLERPPKDLVILWGVCIVTFLSGFFRGNLGPKISIYDLGSFKYFSLGGDGIVFFRMMGLFALPWLLKNSIRENRGHYLFVFIQALKISLLISVLLAFLDYLPLKMIHLENWGYYSDEEFWRARSHGTFFTPLEAGFMYGGFVVYLLTGTEKLRGNILNPLLLVLLTIGLVLTHTGTAFVAFFVALLFYVLRRRDISISRGKLSLIGVAALLIFLLLCKIILPPQFLEMKVGDFLYRVRTWQNWVHQIPEHPWILFTGVGFSRICSDNNFILFLIQGGILYLAAVLNWTRKLILSVPQSYQYIFVFWITTWLSLDAMPYWGIGRLCWFLFGLLV